MASENSFHSRMYFLCPLCKKAPYSLPGHLRKSCMSNSSEAEIQAVVKEAKKELSEFSHNGRFWEFKQIREIWDSTDPLARMIAEMQKRGFVIRNIPPVLPTRAEPSVSTASVPQRRSRKEQKRAESPGSSSPATIEPSSKESSGEYYQSSGETKCSNEVRLEMQKKGLYKKHSLHHPLLQGFSDYLHKDLRNRNSKQEVESVSRFMYYLDPSEPNLKFVRDVEKVREYFSVLSDTKLSKQTVLNYWKSLKRFMKYIITSTGIPSIDPALYEDCKSFMDPLYDIQAGITKKVSKKIKNCLPTNCLAVLDVARKDFLAAMGKLQGPVPVTGEDLTKNERLLILYYLEAIVMLKLLQRPGVITNMTVKEWLGRSRRKIRVSVAVKEHKTVKSQIAEVLLSDEEELWFNIYYNKVRPLMLKDSGSGNDNAANRKFFVSSSGRPIHKPSNDLKRLHDKYNIPSVTSGEARKSSETLGHTPETAKKHSRKRTPTDAFLATGEVNQLVEKTRQGIAGPSRQKTMDEHTAFKVLSRSWPVTLDGYPPKRVHRQKVCAKHERYCYDRWRSEQLKLREKHIIEHFGGRQPSQRNINAWVERQGWTSNVPLASVILNQWKPIGGIDSVLDSIVVQKMVTSQHWKGLSVRDVPEKGCGVFTKRHFTEGEVVCDFHGQQVSKEEGRAIQSSTPNMHPGFFFFYENNRNETVCIDAHEETCRCHPLSIIYGRLINHSGKKANIRPRLFVHNGSDVILFIALRNISVDEELLYDYGDKRKRYAGKGLELEWA